MTYPKTFTDQERQRQEKMIGWCLYPFPPEARCAIECPVCHAVTPLRKSEGEGFNYFCLECRAWIQWQAYLSWRDLADPEWRYRYEEDPRPSPYRYSEGWRLIWVAPSARVTGTFPEMPDRAPEGYRSRRELEAVV